MVLAAKFHVNTVLKLKIIFKDLIKLPTLAGKKTKKTVVKVKPALQGYRVYQYCTKKLDDLSSKNKFSQFHFKLT